MSVNDKSGTKKLVITAFLVALIIVLQLVANFFKIGAVSISLVLIPITVGGFLMGPLTGAVLGFFFGAVCFIYALIGLDPFTLTMILYNPGMTVLLCFGKAILAGLLPALLFKGLMKATGGKIIPSALISAIFVPVINTGIFVIGSATIFKNFIKTAFGVEADVTAFTLMGVVISAVIVNFIFELVSNVLLSTAISASLSKSKYFARLVK